MSFYIRIGDKYYHYGLSSGIFLRTSKTYMDHDLEVINVDMYEPIGEIIVYKNAPNGRFHIYEQTKAYYIIRNILEININDFIETLCVIDKDNPNITTLNWYYTNENLKFIEKL